MRYAASPTEVAGYALELEAVDRTRNIARRYRIESTRDLFGSFIVDLSWGRIGSIGRSRRVSFENECAARSFIRSSLGLCGRSRKRFGVEYKIAH